MKKILIVLTLFLITIFHSQTGGVGINTTNPAIGSDLTLGGTNKSLLLNRVSLTGSTDTSTIMSPQNGMIVYNTSTINDVVNGLYLYDISGWVRLNSGYVAVRNEKIFDDTNYYYVSMTKGGTNWEVVRYDKNDPNSETKSTGTGVQPSNLTSCQSLTYN